jgi:DNA-binding NarL/FixJ family response regulator
VAHHKSFPFNFQCTISNKTAVNIWRIGDVAIEQNGLAKETEPSSAFVASATKVDGFIAVIEARTFLQECIRRSARLALPLPILTYSTVFELEQQDSPASPAIVILSLAEAGSQAVINTLTKLTELFPGTPVILLADKSNPELALAAIRHGARGYIPFTMAFDIAVKAMRFVLAGGTYVPTDCFLAGGWSDVAATQRSPSRQAVTSRELAVVRAIQEGKSNKVIAYHLNMCESTVKAHLRNIMKKLKAKNRTDVAIKARTLLSLTPSVGAHLEFPMRNSLSTRNSLGLFNSSDNNDDPAIGALSESLRQPVEPAGKPGSAA